MREIREAFQVLDRDNDGLVNKDDVADVLMNIGELRSDFYGLYIYIYIPLCTLF